MWFLWPFNTLGEIFGQVMLAGALVAAVVCLWATWYARTPGSVRPALIAAFLPLAAGIGAAAFGLVFCLNAGLPLGDAWGALAKCILAGAIMSAIPVLWSFGLRRRLRSQGPAVA